MTRENLIKKIAEFNGKYFKGEVVNYQFQRTGISLQDEKSREFSFIDYHDVSSWQLEIFLERMLDNGAKV